jgi:Rrf2 family protein
MAQNETGMYSAKQLYQTLKIPPQYLRQLLTSLSKNGFIKSTRGRNGGFVFAKSTQSIFIAEVIDAVEGLDVFNTCMVGFEKCPFANPCPLHETWTETRQNVINILKITSLAQFKKNRLP